MRVLIFGVTGMVGQGVLRECLLAADVEQVVVVGRTAIGIQHQKLKEIIQADLFNLSAIESELQPFDACYFCLGVSSSGMSEATYTRLTYDLTIAVAEVLSRHNPQMSFVYVSGSGTDSTEHGKSMWARVKGRTENALMRLPFKAVYSFRPGVIQPLHGARSKTPQYQIFYSLFNPILPLLRRLMPASILTTEIVGQAMLAVTRSGAPQNILSSSDINDAAQGSMTEQSENKSSSQEHVQRQGNGQQKAQRTNRTRARILNALIILIAIVISVVAFISFTSLRILT